MGNDPRLSHIWGSCAACEAPLRDGMKLNVAPVAGQPDVYEAFCDQCVREAEARLDASTRPQ